MKIFLTFVCLVLLCACSDGLGGQRVSDGWGDGQVKEVMLSDGTKCAVLIGFEKGAIDCNWK